MHVLDNGIWHALTGPHATLAERTPLAARYVPEVSVFAGIPDDPTPEAWGELRDLIGAGGGAFLARTDLMVPDGLTMPGEWSVFLERPCRQMWLPAGSDANPGAAGEPDVVALDGADVPEMLALVKRTEPGPFLARTIELGTYVGVRRDGALIAMAGERIRPPGFTEISAVCTDPAFRGRGLASQLVRMLVSGIRARGDTPFLHLTLENEPAHRVYAALGFETRASVSVVGVRAPG